MEKEIAREKYQKELKRLKREGMTFEKMWALRAKYLLGKPTRPKGK